MKKLILVAAAIALSASAYAQTDSTDKKMSPPDINNTIDDLDKNQNIKDDKDKNEQNHPDGVVMRSGKIMKVKDGKMTVLDKDMTMSNGTKIRRDGTYTKKDGTKMTMIEGQHMDMSGNIDKIKTKKD